MEDKLYMQRAIYLANCADSNAVKTNPKVGAVLVYNDRIIGEGYHRKYGEAHAEVNCINSVSPEDRQYISLSTMYVTLEPCAHQGKTPSCAHLLVSMGIKRIIVGTLDPYPQVAGKGCDILRSANIDVKVGLMARECRQVAKFFMCNQLHKRPYITLKWAESKDGFIDRIRRTDEAPTMISTPYIQLLTHKLRGEYMGIMIGKGTYLYDHPTLTNRLYPPLSSPEIFLLDSKKKLEKEISDRPHWHIVADSYDLPRMLNNLLAQGISSILIEGGAKVLQSFIDANLWDEIRQEVGNKPLHYGVKAPVLDSAFPATNSYIDGHLIRHYIR